MSSAAPQATGTCAVHAGVDSAGVCGRCGRFVCNDCVAQRRLDPPTQQFLGRCTECVLREDYAEAVKGMARLKRGLPVWLALVGLLYFVLGGLGTANGLRLDNESLVRSLAIGLGGLTMLVADFMLIRTWSSRWAWIGTGISSVPALLLIIGVGGSFCVVLFFGLLTARLAVGAFRMQEFEGALDRAKERPDLFDTVG